MQVQSDIIAILKDMTQEWDMDLSEINSETKLMEDLGFVSVDIIHLVVSIEEHFKQKLGFNALLMQNGRYVDDLSIEEISNFVSSQLTGAK
ncbi:MAG: acyl carrier protein [Coleofasciculaceae cyanobacterium]|jgi:acyl carrier protein